MPRDLLHNHPQFADLIRIVAAEHGIDPALVEKDDWIMHGPYGLQQLGLAFELKGGTSLSKGFQIIHRFSEDIDIRIASMNRIGRLTIIVMLLIVALGAAWGIRPRTSQCPVAAIAVAAGKSLTES
jgi:Nucleotidyl transferase AbiEii toxin, Type IV TA system